MPAVSQVQQQMMGADLRRALAGKRTRTGMSVTQLREFASTRRKGLPHRKGGLKAAMKAREKMGRRAATR